MQNEFGRAACVPTIDSVSAPYLAPRLVRLGVLGAPGNGFAIVVLGLAFLLALAPIRNSDFWLHLASGRNIVAGQDASFSYLQHTPWVNRTWLYDVLVYESFLYVGETQLVALKACLAVVLTLFLLATGKVGPSLWISGGAVMLTLAAAGPWLSFRPVFVSYLGFAATLCILRCRERGASALKVLVSLAVLFAVWANLDAWFIVGVLLVCCRCMALMLRRETQAGGMPKRPITRREAALIMFVCAAACVANPNHVFAFAPPAEWVFSGGAPSLQTDALLRAEFVAPWSNLYLSRGLLVSGPGLAFWLLAVSSLLSFTTRLENMGRGLVWIVFFVLSFRDTRLIPFFCIAAGTTLALNLGERIGGGVAAGRRVLLAKTGLILTGLMLGAAAWIGLFQGGPLEPRSCNLDVDPTFVHLADLLRQWRCAGHLGDGNGFHSTPEAANQLAWFCPQERSFLNSHLRVSPAEISDYTAVRNGLLGMPGSEQRDWRGILRAHRINHVVMYSSHAAEAEKAVWNLAKARQEWALLYLGGGAAVFGWRDPREISAGSPSVARFEPFAVLEKTLDQLALAANEAQAVPAVWPGREPQARRWWQAFWKGRNFRAPDLREAHLALAGYDALIPMYHAQRVRAWSVCAAAASVAGAGGTIGPTLFTPDGETCQRLFLSGQDAGPTAALYLAIRAARRAIRQDPDEPRAYFTLGEAYYRLNTATREPLWAAALPGLGRIRTVQAITAYHNALRLDPDLATAHDRLAHLFITMEYKDLALKHLREYLRCMRRQGPDRGETAEVMEKRLSRPKRILKSLAKDVEQMTERFDHNSFNLKVLDRARLAGHFGLAGKALEILLDSDVSAFGTEGMDLEVKLLLLTGNGENVRLWMNEEHEKILHAYHWNKIQLYAAIGSYKAADDELRRLDRSQTLNRADLTPVDAAAITFSNSILAPNRDGMFVKMPLRVFLITQALSLQTYRLFPDEKDAALAQWAAVEDLRRQAGHDVLRGLLHVESGRIAEAQRLFGRAVAVLKSRSAAASTAETVVIRAVAGHFLGSFGPNSAVAGHASHL